MESDSSVLTCLVCGSIYHFVKDCLVSFGSYNKKKDKDISVYNEIIKYIMGETLSISVGYMILDVLKMYVVKLG